MRGNRRSSPRVLYVTVSISSSVLALSLLMTVLRVRIQNHLGYRAMCLCFIHISRYLRQLDQNSLWGFQPLNVDALTEGPSVFLWNASLESREQPKALSPLLPPMILLIQRLATMKQGACILLQGYWLLRTKCLN